MWILLQCGQGEYCGGNEAKEGEGFQEVGEGLGFFVFKELYYGLVEKEKRHDRH